MPRPARFAHQSFVAAAIALVSEEGAAAATLAQIAARVGAPTGSVYHRFESRAAILATAWLSVHRGFSAKVRDALDQGSGLLAALSISAWARAEPNAARFLLLNGPGSLFGDDAPEALRAEVAEEEAALEDSFRAYVSAAHRRDGTLDSETMARARFLVFDGPIALIAPHLVRDGMVPGFIDAVIREMHAGVAVRREQRYAS